MSSPAANAHGPALIGIFVNAVLYGICILQAFDYYQKFPKDPLWLKIYIAVLMVMDTLSTVFMMAWIYRVLVLQFLNIDALLELDWLLATDPAMVGLTALMVQCFFAWRIRILTKKIWIPIFIALVSLTGCVSGVVFAAAFATYPNLLSLATEYSARVLAAVWLVPAVVADVMITVVLTWNLNSSRTGIASTESILNKLIRITVQNGLLTSTVAIVDLVTFLAMPNSGIHIGFSVPITKLYTNSVLSGLIARAALREANPAWERFNVSSSGPTGISHQLASRPGPEVFVSVEMENRRDPGEISNDDDRDNKMSGWGDTPTTRKVLHV